MKEINENIDSSELSAEATNASTPAKSLEPEPTVNRLSRPSDVTLTRQQQRSRSVGSKREPKRRKSTLP